MANDPRNVFSKFNVKRNITVDPTTERMSPSERMKRARLTSETPTEEGNTLLSPAQRLQARNKATAPAPVQAEAPLRTPSGNIMTPELIEAQKKAKAEWITPAGHYVSTKREASYQLPSPEDSDAIISAWQHRTPSFVATAFNMSQLIRALRDNIQRGNCEFNSAGLTATHELLLAGWQGRPFYESRNRLRGEALPVEYPDQDVTSSSHANKNQNRPLTTPRHTVSAKEVAELRARPFGELAAEARKSFRKEPRR